MFEIESECHSEFRFVRTVHIEDYLNLRRIAGALSGSARSRHRTVDSARSLGLTILGDPIGRAIDDIYAADFRMHARSGFENIGASTPRVFKGAITDPQRTV